MGSEWLIRFRLKTKSTDNEMYSHFVWRKTLDSIHARTRVFNIRVIR